MYDRQTESLWSQLLGESVKGPLIGTKLEFVPSWMMTWEEWKTQYPDTLALNKNGRRGGRDSYTSYYASASPGVIGETFYDDRLYTKEFVTGVELEEANQFYDPQELVMGVSFNGDSRAYSAPFLSNHEIVNDTVGGVKIAVTW